jgi:asparagine synthetase B (glutamine-hydrolysing)
MRDDYKIKTATAKLEVEVEKEIAERIKAMEQYTKIPASELANTALKRFISSHKDFLPPADRK